MTVPVALLPLIQLPDSVGRRAPLIWGQTEVTQAVLGVLVLAESARWGTLARSFWQGLVGVHGGVLVLCWWCATREGVLSGWGTFVLSLLYFDPLLHLFKGTSPLNVLLCVISRWLWGPLIRPCCDAVGFQYGAGCGDEAISCANAGGQSRSGS